MPFIIDSNLRGLLHHFFEGKERGGVGGGAVNILGLRLSTTFDILGLSSLGAKIDSLGLG